MFLGIDAIYPDEMIEDFSVLKYICSFKIHYYAVLKYISKNIIKKALENDNKYNIQMPA